MCARLVLMGGAVKNLNFSLTDALEQIQPDTGVIVTHLLEIYRGSLNQNESEEKIPVGTYNGIHIDAFAKTLGEILFFRLTLS